MDVSRIVMIKNHHFSLMRSQFGSAFSSDNSGDGPMKENKSIFDFLTLPQNKDQEKKDAQNARRRQAYAQSKQAEGSELKQKEKNKIPLKTSSLQMIKRLT